MKLIRYEDTVTSGERVTVIYGSFIPEEDRALISLQSFYISGHVDVQSLALSVETAAALAKMLFHLVRDAASEEASADEKASDIVGGEA